MNSCAALSDISRSDLEEYLKISSTWVEFKTKCGLPRSRRQDAIRAFLDSARLDYSHLPTQGARGMQQKSKLWSISTDEFKSHVAESKSWTELLQRCGYSDLGNISTARKRIKKLEISCEHLSKRPEADEFNCETLIDNVEKSKNWRDLSRLTGFVNRKRLIARLNKLGINYEHIAKKSAPLTAEEVLKEDTNVRKPTLRRLLLEERSECAGCKKSEWQGYNMPLRVVHLNKNSRDNRTENLALMCPNCLGVCRPTRILIIGSSGSGKTNIAKSRMEKLPKNTLFFDDEPNIERFIDKIMSTPYWIICAQSTLLPPKVKNIATELIYTDTV